jgi:Protein of unknown function (DUF2380)
MRTMLRILLALCLLIATQASGQPQLPPMKDHPKVAFFGIVLIDTSHEAQFFGSEPEKERIVLLENYVRDYLLEKGVELVDTKPVEEELNRIASFADCNGCEVRAAEKLGADYSLVGEVQKVSTLIQSMNLVLRDSETGQMVRGLSVDIRNNSDEAWLRGARYILNNNFYREQGN